jgi:hypothetical protein
LHDRIALRRRLGIALLIVLAGVGAYLVFGASDERRVLAVLRELSAAVSVQPGDTDASRHQRVHSALVRLATPELTLETPELGRHTGSESIVALLGQAGGVALRVAIEQSSVHTEADRAQVTLLVAFSLNRLGEERRQKRTVSAELSRGPRGFLLERLRVSSPSREQPEPRP